MERLFLLVVGLLAVALVSADISGGGYSVNGTTTAAVGGMASGGNYSASTTGTMNGGGASCNATIGPYPSTCAVCGNGVRELGEECDLGSGNNASCPSTCSTACVVRVCGGGSSSSGGGGGGGGGFTGAINITKEDVAKDAVQTSDVRAFRYQTAGTVTYALRNTAFTRISLTFTDFVESARVNVYQYKAKPAAVIDAVDAYQYLGIEHSGLESVEGRVVEFRVTKAWLTNRSMSPDDIGLLRWEDAWVSYAVARTNETNTTYEYRCELPGFSYFAIARKSAYSTPTPSTEVNSMNQTPAQSAPDTTTAVPETQEAATQDTVLAAAKESPAPIEPAQDTKIVDVVAVEANEGSGMFSGMKIVGFLTGVVVILLIGGFFWFHKKAPAPPKKPQENPAQATPSAPTTPAAGPATGPQPASTPADHDPAKPVREYILQMRAAGAPDSEIRMRLTKVGWDPLIIDMELIRK